jgi:hypothetical protein
MVSDRRGKKELVSGMLYKPHNHYYRRNINVEYKENSRTAQN